MAKIGDVYKGPDRTVTVASRKQGEVHLVDVRDGEPVVVQREEEVENSNEYEKLVVPDFSWVDDDALWEALQIELKEAQDGLAELQSLIDEAEGLPERNDEMHKEFLQFCRAKCRSEEIWGEMTARWEE